MESGSYESYTAISSSIHCKLADVFSLENVYFIIIIIMYVALICPLFIWRKFILEVFLDS